MTVCPHCLRPVEAIDLIEPFKIPEGCVCNPREWGDPQNIPPTCDHFDPMSGDEDKLCLHCEHERGCHKN